MVKIDWTGNFILGMGSLLCSFPVAVAFQSPWPLLIGVLISIPLHILVQYHEAGGLGILPRGTVSTEIAYRKRLKQIKWEQGSWQRDKAVMDLKREFKIRDKDYNEYYEKKIEEWSGFGEGRYGE